MDYVCVVCFFFFKQKTAYEMRISDWSSDVCSSDLSVIQKVLRDGPPLRSVPPQDEREKGESVCAEEPLRSSKWRLEASLAQQIPSDDHPHHLVGDRKSVV